MFRVRLLVGRNGRVWALLAAANRLVEQSPGSSAPSAAPNQASASASVGNGSTAVVGDPDE
jgi:hypothetical protein